MKKFIILFLCVISIQANTVLPSKPWTVFVYLSGHNDLAQHLQFTGLNSLPAGANNNVNIVASFNGLSDKQVPTTQRYIINAQNKLEQIGSAQQKTDAGSGSFLNSELNFAIKEAPSTNLALFLAGDANGIATNSSFIDTNSNHSLTDIDIQNMLKVAGKTVNILGLDTSYMASLEYLTAFADYTTYIIASQDNDPGDGFPYDKILSSLKNSTDPKKFAIEIVNEFNKKYKSDMGQPNFTLSAVDSSKVKAVAQNIDSTSTILLGLLKTNKKDVQNLISKTITSVTTFNNVYLDLSDFYTKLITNIGSNKIFDALKTNLTQGLTLIKQAVIKNGTKTPGASGISIHAPLQPGKFCCTSGYLGSYFNKTYPNWVKFLQAYLA
ncbi:MAG: clostripain-related cysteine peptidase [Candidatus Babeliales bacterium]|nr:clostripain-related cysteine peptidase [Candidatus Babeliales bacterium]